MYLYIKAGDTPGVSPRLVQPWGGTPGVSIRVRRCFDSQGYTGISEWVPCLTKAGTLTDVINSIYGVRGFPVLDDWHPEAGRSILDCPSAAGLFRRALPAAAAVAAAAHFTYRSDAVWG